MASPIMIQGTMSNVGKSVLTGGLCRVFRQDGYKVAPFKSQNMALNSYITKDGLEMGRAQVMQAEAAGIEPEALMNPILLKPTNDTGSQVILNGEVQGVMSAMEYFRHKKDYVPHIMDAYRKLDERFDIIVIEGAGSPAEINLKSEDIVNMGMAEMADAPVLLAGDIDRGGVFAQIVGTIELLEEHERRRIKGTVINKFRGDKEILKPGLRMLEEKTHIPVCGVVPYFHLDIDEEDSLSERFACSGKKGLADVAVIRFPRISNFTDLMPLEAMDEIGVRYVRTPEEFGTPDAVILPGSKNTMADLRWMRESGLEAKVLRHASAGKMVFGICGGYQMMGELLSDPEKVEEGGTMRGMGLLPVRTVFAAQKTRTRVHGSFEGLHGSLKGLSGAALEGYEIHMGTTEDTKEPAPLVKIAEETGAGRKKYDGAQAGNCYGCYVHGIFEHPAAAAGFAEALLLEKGYRPGAIELTDWHTYKETQYNKLADIIRESLDMRYIYEVIGKGSGRP